jgi:iron complex transport system substrate-binding protein
MIRSTTIPAGENRRRSRRRFTIHFATMPVIAILLVTGCLCLSSMTTGATESPEPTPIPASAPALSVTDALGRTVVFSHSPQRIVLAGRAAFSLTDTVYLFPEATSRVVAMGRTTQRSREFLPVMDSKYSGKTILENEAGPEQIAAIHPDLILMKSSQAGRLGQTVEKLGIPLIYLDLETPDQFNQGLTIIGRIFGNEPRAKELIAFFRERTDRISRSLSDLKEEQKPRVLVVYYSERDGGRAFNVPPLTWMQTLMVQQAGGRPVWREATQGQGWTKVGLEQIAVWDPDQIYVIAYFDDIAPVVERLKADPQFQILRAVKHNRFFGFPADYYCWDQPDPRWILGLTWLAKRIHPERFSGLDLKKEIRLFYRELYSLGDEAFLRDIQPMLSGDLQ